MDEKTALEKTERLPARLIAESLAGEDSVFFNVSRFEHAQRVGKVLAESSMIPEHFRNNIGNCLIALNLAQRMRVDVFMLMQTMYVVHGRPGIEGKLAIALIEGTGRFSPIQFRFSGEGVTDNKVKRPDFCIAYATDLKTKQVIEGPEVTWEMAKAEGWIDKKGTQTSKWQTLPGLMFRYRAATFFARVNCPGALLGLRTTDELEDMRDEIRIGASPALSSDLKDKANEEALQSFTASIPAGTNPELLSKFIDATATANRSTIDRVRVEASKNLESFWNAFTTWKEKQGLQPERRRGRGPAKPKQENAPAGEPPIQTEEKTGEMIACPEDPSGGTQKYLSFCNEKCNSRDGCPAFPAQ